MSRLITSVELSAADANKWRPVLEFKHRLPNSLSDPDLREQTDREPADDYEEVTVIRQEQRRLSAAQKREVIERYLNHEPVAEIAASFGINRQMVSQICRAAGVPPLPRGLDQKQVETAVRMYIEGKSLKTIALKLGSSGNTVRAALMAREVRLRPKPGS